ncbi:hypothetical protein RM844_22385 [Streptomyces sp. DSM 44915]|uniref:Uncharacterized protein n=1 Tax=Streptomyces chisholmiae TaxID=3075540 RepID=A0ABU2JWB8_9ACTN|nr:hypothetical protein [Streptomyces sp. DSM 44915]MDT0269038.1 hypothetical protein [Streptomyces sp. DSM 44915]
MSHHPLTTPAPRHRRPAARALRPLERRPIGTNGYVSTWGALTGLCPPAAG